MLNGIETGWEADTVIIEHIQHLNTMLYFGSNNSYKFIVTKKDNKELIVSNYDCSLLKLDRDGCILLPKNKNEGSKYSDIVRDDIYIRKSNFGEYVIKLFIDTDICNKIIKDMYHDSENQYILTPRSETQACGDQEVVDTGDVVFVTNFVKNSKDSAYPDILTVTNILGTSFFIRQHDLIQYWEVTKYKRN